MRNYELTLILSPYLSEQEIQTRLESIISTVQNAQGIFGSRAVLGKRHLAVADKKISEGFVAVVSFMLTPEKLDIMRKSLTQDAAIIRFFVMIKKHQSERVHSARRNVINKTNEASSSPIEEPALPKTPEQQEATKESVDKKLEEIFQT